MNKTRYSATEFGRNKPMNFRASGTLSPTIEHQLVVTGKVAFKTSVSIRNKTTNLQTNCSERKRKKEKLVFLNRKTQLP